MWKPLISLTVLSCGALAVAFAPSPGTYDLSWFTIDGGGGPSAGGDLLVTGTIGQGDASVVALTGSDYLLYGGFWIEAPGSPSSETICPDDPSDFFKQFGGAVTGDGSRLCADDDTRLEVVQSAQLSPLLPFIRLDYWAHTTFAPGGVTALEYHINGHVSALVGGGQNPDTLRTRIRNYAGGFELVDSRGTGAFADEDIIHLQIANASDYVQAGDGEIRVRQEAWDPGNALAPNWSLEVDLYEVTVNP